ncbi:pentapeptide repeat-containing protein [Micromonospora chersina]|uniref:pentapeptide repeat-containing protein n=1 Tax=Micromonospora chersina TaxID=47854 RepID=UPI003D93E6BD
MLVVTAAASRSSGPFGVVTATVVALGAIVLAIGGATFQRTTKIAVAATTTIMIGLAFVGWQTGVLPDEPVQGVAATPSRKPTIPAPSASVIRPEHPTAGADLRGAVLDGQHLAGASLKGVHASGASMVGAVLDGANLAGADLRGAQLAGVRLPGASLRGANLAGANLSDAVLADACLIGADITGADLTRANFTGAVVDPRAIGDLTEPPLGWNTPSGAGRAACAK